MGIEEFKQRPFLNHRQYDSSCFSMGQQPEYSTGDVLLASCYRVLRLAPTAESSVDLESIRMLPSRLQTDSVPSSVWGFVIQEALRSPPKPGERSIRPLPQVVPLVPSLGNLSGVLGRPRSRWNPGMLALYTLASGVGPASLQEAVSAFVQALDAVENDDDEFAWFLEYRLRDLPETARSGDTADWLK